MMIMMMMVKYELKKMLIATRKGKIIIIIELEN